MLSGAPNTGGIPKRIISLVPSQTELLCSLGLENEISGITKFCVHPRHLKKNKAIVGGTKKVNYEKISVLRPDIIICNKEENTLEMVNELRNIAPVWVTDIKTIDDNIQLITDFGRVFNKAEDAARLIAEFVSAKTQFHNFIKSKPERKTAYFIWKDPWMATGSGTFINEMLKLNRFENVYAGKTRYPEIAITDGEYPVELVLLSSEPYPFKESHFEEARRFFPNAQILLVDGEMFSWYGCRPLKALEYFVDLHQKIK